MLRLLAWLGCGAILFAQQTAVDRAWNLVRSGNQPEAIQVLRTTIKSNPQDAEAHLFLGSLLMENGDRSESIAQLTEAVRLRPQSAEAQNALGEAYNNFGDVKAARGPFEKAVAIDPGFGTAHVNLGLVMLQAGEFNEAAAQLDRAIKLLGKTEDGAYARYLRAKVYSAQDNPRSAAEQLEQAVAVRPNFTEAWSDLGQARKVLLDDAGALAAEKRAVELNPNDAIAQYRLGTEYLHRDQAELAVTHLREAFRLNAADQSTLNALQSALRLDGKTEEANSVKQRLTELLREKDRSSQNALKAVKLNNEGSGLEKSEDLRGALDKYRQAVELYPTHVGIRVNYAVLLLRLGQWTEGLNQLHDAAQRDPGNTAAKTALSDALAQAPAGSVPRWDDGSNR